MAIGLQGDSSMWSVGNWTSSAPTSSSSTASTFSTLGPMLAVTGMVTGAIGSYYSAKSQQNQLKSQSMTMDFQKAMSDINAKQAELQAQTLLETGQKQIGQVTMRAGQVKSASRASMAARGIDISSGGTGNVADVFATTDLMKEIDSLTINTNSVRASEAARTQSMNYTTQGMMQGVSANNLRASADSISAGVAVSTSLIGGATAFANAWYADKQNTAMNRLLARTQ